MFGIKRREFIIIIGGAAAWPLAARAQTKRMRRVGVLMGLVVNDPEAKSRVTAFENGLQELGWIKGGNLSIEYRWAGGGNLLRRPRGGEWSRPPPWQIKAKRTVSCHKRLSPHLRFVGRTGISFSKTTTLRMRQRAPRPTSTRGS
jgi:hypothetical protein